MKNILFALFVFLLIINTNCQTGSSEPKEEFSEQALNQSIYNLNGNSSSLREMLQSYEGKTVVLEVWASWCGDCIKGLPKLKKLQEEFPEVAFVMLSVDDKENAWKKGIEKYNIQAEHYFFNTGWDNHFTKYIELSWIPRYLVLDKTGKIIQYNSTSADDPELKEIIKNSMKH